MADRSLVYRIRADITDFASKVAVASRGLDDVGKKASAADKEAAKFRKGMDTLGRSAGKVGLVAAAGLGAAVVASARFNKAMSAVQAATHESAKNMEELRAAALKAGADTVFSATEAASAVENLAKAGVSTKDILNGGLNGALSLAAAGTIDVGQAAEIAATAMTQFKQSGQDVPHIADLLAAGAGRAQGEVTDLAFALNQVGLVANQSGQSIEQTVGTLSAFASAGLLGSDSGTSLKTFLLQLVPATTAAAKAMEAYGLIAYDANEANKTLAKDGIHAASNSIDDVTRAVSQYLVTQGVAKEGTTKLAKATQEYMMKMGLLRSQFTEANGDFKSLSDIAGVLRDKLADLSQSDRQAALKKLFGQDAVRAATVLYDQGAQGIDRWVGKVDESGYAAETAAIKMNNLSGDLEQLRGSLETAFIGMGEGAQGPLRVLTKGLTGAVNGFNGLSDAGKSTVTALLASTATLGGGAFLGAKVIGGIADTRKALKDLGVQASTTRGLMVNLGRGVALGGILLSLGALDEALDGIFSRDLNETNLGRSLKALNRGTVNGTLADVFGKDLKGFNHDLDSLDNNLAKINSFTWDKIIPGDITDLDQARSNFEKLDQALANMVESGQRELAEEVFQRLADKAKQGGNSVGQLKDALHEYEIALKNANFDAPVTRSPNLDRTILGPLAKGPSDQREDSPFLSGVNLSTRATNRATGATDKNTRSNERNTMSLKDQMQAIKDATNQRLAALDAEIGYQQAIDDATAAAKENGRTAVDNGKRLDLTTEKGRSNAQALYAVADGWNNLSKRMKNAPGAFKEARENFIDLAKKMGLNQKAAETLADQILQIPSKKVEVKVDTAPATKKITAFKRLYDSLRDKDITIRATTIGYHVNKDGHLGGTILKATGGYISGPGTGTSDSIPAWLSNGEYVINARATARHRQLLEQINANRYASGGYVGGGSVSMPSSLTARFSERDLALLGQIVRHAGPMFANANFYGDGQAERQARLHQAMGGS